jgi:tripartite-type tricarboxylate transporter receptor subunit TctC
MNFLILRRYVFGGIALLIAISVTAVAAEYPTRQVRIVVGAVSGGGVDITGRVIAAKLSEQLGQQFFVDNRPGAGGNVGSEFVAKSPPDGHTLLMGTIAVLAINPSLYKELALDPLRDFAPISRAADSTNILVVHPALPVKSVKELIALARVRPGDLVYGSSGVGTAGHLSGELFSSMAGLKLIHVPYKGGPPSMIDLIAGRLQIVGEAVPKGLVKRGADTIRHRIGHGRELPRRIVELKARVQQQLMQQQMMAQQQQFH